MSLYEAIGAAKEHKIKFTGSTVTLKVEGLKDAVEVDPLRVLMYLQRHISLRKNCLYL